MRTTMAATLLPSSSTVCCMPLSSSSSQHPNLSRNRIPSIQCSQFETQAGDVGSKLEKRKYKDSITDLIFINGCRQAFGRVAGWQSPRTWEEGYEGMVEVSHALARNRSAAEQQAAVLKGFPKVPNWFRKLFPYSDWGAELNARITPLFFSWLVGPCQVVEVTFEGKTLWSGVQIEKCRYLETSGCTGLCVNSCKMPTQYFFTTELGMPLTMEPNFEDLSCRMIFGQAAPKAEHDPAFQQACFGTCPTSNPSAQVCPKLR